MRNVILLQEGKPDEFVDRCVVWFDRNLVTLFKNRRWTDYGLDTKKRSLVTILGRAEQIGYALSTSLLRFSVTWSNPLIGFSMALISLGKWR